MKKKLLLGALLVGSVFTANAQFSESFEGSTEIPEGWSVINEGDTNTWNVIDLEGSTLNAQEGTYVATIQYGATAHNDFLVTPAITVTEGVSDFISFWGRSRDAAYPETISVKLSNTTSTSDAFTVTLIESVAPPSGQSFTNYQIDLSDYIGETIYIGFLSTTTDQFVFDLDNVVVSGAPSCGVPTNFSASNITPTTYTIEWEAPTVGNTPVGYEFEYGPADFTQGEGELLEPTETSVEIEGLSEGTVYQFYIRTNCGESFGEWDGPYSFTTPFGAANLPYSFGFEPTPMAGGWSSQTVAGAEWGIYIGNDVAAPYEGEQFAGIVGAAVASDSWFFSRPINIEADQTVDISYYLEFVALIGTGSENNLTVTIGDDATPEAQTNVVGTFENYTTTPYTLQNHEFTASESGVYYVGFHYTAPAHTETDNGGLLLDSFSVTDALNVDNILASQFSVYPNPANNVINISNADNILVNGVQIVDINGRVVKSVKFDNVTEAQINVADLSAGMYLMTISSDNGTTTKKIVKN